MIPSQDTLNDHLSRLETACPGVLVRWSRAGSGIAVLHVAWQADHAAVLDGPCRTLLQGNGGMGIGLVAPPGADARKIGISLSAALSAMADAGVFADSSRIAVIGYGPAADLAAKVAAVLPKAHAVVFLNDEEALPKVDPGFGWLVADQFGRRIDPEILPAGWRVLIAPGMGPDIQAFLRQTNLLVPVLKALVEQTNTAVPYAQMIRARRLTRLWRLRMEQHMRARGREEQIAGFARNFRRYVTRNRPETTKAEPPPMPRVPRQPRSLGNIWHLQERGDALIYLSDQYEGQVLGFEERNGRSLGQTGPVAIGMVSIGGAATVRPLPESFDYHLTDEQLTARPAARGAQAHATHTLRAARQMRRALASMITLSEPLSGMCAVDAAAGSELMIRLRTRIAQARVALQHWNKLLFIDRVILDLLGGELTRSEEDLERLYPRLIADLRHEIALAAGQNSLPTVVLSQSSGLREDGKIPLILVEGRLEQRYHTMGIVVATPIYPFRLMHDTVATLEAEDRLLVDELESLAVAAVQGGQDWYCPTMRQVIQTDNRLFVDFVALAPLVLEVAPHGFHLEGCVNGASIISVSASGKRVTLIFDHPPTGEALHLCYAWGHQRVGANDGRFANHGALRDCWSAPSLMVPGRVLHRFALAARLPVMPSDLE